MVDVTPDCRAQARSVLRATPALVARIEFTMKLVG